MREENKKYLKKEQIIEHSRFLIILSGKNDDGYSVKDRFIEILQDNQELIGFTDVEEFDSDLTTLAVKYLFTNTNIIDDLGSRFQYCVLKLSGVENYFNINEELDSLFRDSVISFEGTILATLNYLIKGDKFHKVSNGRLRGEVLVDDHIETRDSLDDTDMFYRHFYRDSKYTDKQIALISKMMLVTE